MINKTKVGKTYNKLIQVVILLLAYWFIYDQVFYRKNLPQIWKALMEDFNNDNFAWLLAGVILLMFVNWAIEAVKWRYLMAKIERINFWKSYEAVLTGVTVSSFTPNRIGEYFGRVFILNSGSRVEGILITILGSMSQLLITVFTGSAALLLFIPLYLTKYWDFNGYLYYVLVAIVVSFNALILGFYLNVSFLSTLKEKILRNGLKKIRKFFRIFAFYHNRELITVLLYSLFRYIIFSFQFFILLHIFNVPIPYLDAMMLISLIYFVMAIIPTIALTELGIRGSVALYFFGIYFSGMTGTMDEINFGVLAATTLLWAINLGVPALMGSVFVFRLKFFRKSANNENG
ncbi:MAG: flippase-like domain-containing protein [Bacteroidales bacterium]|nr:flippase-like domain-containing protein [Bacteroidales bacterium]